MSAQGRSIEQFADSAALLEFKARTMARGLQTGKHLSSRLGQGMEFHSYRNYVQGDDLRLVDWKRYAKTGEYFIRQSTIERSQHLHIDLDISTSMDYQEQATSKLALATLITGCLTYVISQQGDGYSWRAGDSYFQRSFGLHNWRRSIIDLDKIASSNSTFVNPSHQNSSQEGITIWITDLYMDRSVVEDYIARNTGPHVELCIIHLIGRNEEELSFDANTKFVDLESGEKLQVNTKQYAEQYQTVLSGHLADIKKLCLEKKTIIHKIYLDDDLPMALRQFLSVYNQLSN